MILSKRELPIIFHKNRVLDYLKKCESIKHITPSKVGSEVEFSGYELANGSRLSDDEVWDLIKHLCETALFLYSEVQRLRGHIAGCPMNK